MTADVTSPVDGSDEIIASVDSGAGRSEFVIADITVDDAWLAVRLSDAQSLVEWR